jgi:hypothetical protein
MTLLVVVPDEILQLIFEFVPNHNLLQSVSRTCRLWNYLISDEEFWLINCEKHADRANISALMYFITLNQLQQHQKMDKLPLLQLLTLNLKPELNQFVLNDRDYIKKVSNEANEFIYFRENKNLETLVKDDENIISEVPLQSMFGTLPIAYMEMTLTSGKDVSIGLAESSYKLDNQPGWKTNSCGYHADDGGIFIGPASTATAKRQKYTTGDTVGVGIHSSNTVFFTKNGELQMIACKIPDGVDPLRVCIGMWKEARVKLNFGKDRFKFDLATLPITDTQNLPTIGQNEEFNLEQLLAQGLPLEELIVILQHRIHRLEQMRNDNQPDDVEF